MNGLAAHSRSLSCLSTPLESSPSTTPPCSWPTMVNSQGLELTVPGNRSVFHTQLSSEEELKLWNVVGMGEQGRLRNPILALMSSHVLSPTFLGNPVLQAIKPILYLPPTCLPVSLSTHTVRLQLYFLTITPSFPVPWKMET